MCARHKSPSFQTWEYVKEDLWFFVPSCLTSGLPFYSHYVTSGYRYGYACLWADAVDFLIHLGQTVPSARLIPEVLMGPALCLGSLSWWPDSWRQFPSQGLPFSSRCQLSQNGCKSKVFFYFGWLFLLLLEILITQYKKTDFWSATLYSPLLELGLIWEFIIWS